MKILITGNTGYIGNYMKNYLSEKTDYSINTISLRGEKWLSINFSEYDIIFHCAGVTPKSGIGDDLFFKVNRDITFKLAQKCKKDGVRHFIYLSSMAVYGVKPSIKAGIIFQDTLCKPDTAYGKSKYEGEKLINSLVDENFNVSIIRTPSVYGKGSTDYFNQYYYIIKKLPIVPYAFTQCKRSAIYIDNLCELTYLIINSSEYGVFCPADSNALSTTEYIESLQHCKLSRILGKVLEVVCSKMSVTNQMWGSIAYDNSLATIFNSKYQLFDTHKCIEKLKK